MSKSSAEVLKKTKTTDKETDKDDKKDSKKPGKNAMLSWIAAKKK